MTEVICKFCKAKIDRDSAYSPCPKSYYCNEEHYKLQENKIKYKPQKIKNNGEPNDRRELTDYIQKIYIEHGYDKHFIPWQMLMSQVSNILKENKKWSYTTLQYILFYMYEILEINLFSEESNGSILSLVPYYGLDAERYYNQCLKIEENSENFEFTDAITIKKKKYNGENKRYKHISIDKLQ